MARAKAEAKPESPKTKLWTPLPGPQTQAMNCLADELFFGGQAGGGKTALGVGLALTAHRQSIFFRRELTQLQDVIDSTKDMLGDLATYNDAKHRFYGIPGNRILEFGSIPNNNKLNAYKGRPHDLIVFDEVSDFTERQYRFLTGWARTTIRNQRVRIVAMGNPPTSVEGEWVIRRWAAWLDPQHPNPAKPGDFCWYAMVDGKEVERENGEPFQHKGQHIRPRSRTFIPARLDDNPYLKESGYATVLQNLPEPLRSQLLFGDFTIGLQDGAFQTIPTEWVRAAQDRWKNTPRPPLAMIALGVDVARGGEDHTVLAPLIGNWFAPLVKAPGTSTPDGRSVVGLVVETIKDDALIFVDSIGVGASVYDMLRRDNFRAIPINFAGQTYHTDRTGTMAMSNIRAAAYWGLREALDPENKMDLALPPDPELKADLCAPRWKMTAQGVQIESKEEIIKRLGRSPDCADAVALAWYGIRELMRTNWSFAPRSEKTEPSQSRNDLSSESTLAEIPEAPATSSSS